MKFLGFGLFSALLAANAAATTPVPDVSPAGSGQHVFINIPQQRLFLYTDGKLTKAYPVAVGKAMTQTNLGEHKIGPKAFNPTWHIPKSIQKERNDGVKTVPPGPNNPLGPVFVRLGNPKLGLGIHGTNAPSSVPGVRSHGCVRMKSPDAMEFAKSITTGSPASVIYQMATLNVDADKNLWLAAYRDPYSKKNLDTDSLRKSIEAWAKANGKKISTKRINAILKAKTGLANCLTCTGKTKAKAKGPLQSLAWTQGLPSYSKPTPVVVTPPPVKDEVLPEGSAIEVDAGNQTPEAPVTAPVSVPTIDTPAVDVPVSPQAVESPLQSVAPQAAETVEPVYTDVTPTEVPATPRSIEPEDILF